MDIPILKLAGHPTAIALCVALAASSLSAQSIIMELTGDNPGDHLGWSVREAGDVDKDMYPDVVVGVPFDDTAGTDAGRVYIYSGRTGRRIRTFDSPGAGMRLGYSVGGAGDIDKDGFLDVVAGAPGPNYNPATPGMALVFSGRDASVIHTFTGANAGDAFGTSVSAAGDVDRDNFPDVIAGAPGAESGPIITGYARIFSGRTGAPIRTHPGLTPRDRFGAAVTGIGDVNKDGFADVLIGSPLENAAGADSGAARVYSGNNGAVLRAFAGFNRLSEFGSSVRGAGDIDKDTYPDFIIGARFERDTGRVHVISGRTYQLIRLHNGPSRSIWYGQSVSGAGDVNGDNVNDVIVGAPIDGVQSGTPLQTITGRMQVLSGQNGSVIMDLTGPGLLSWYGFSVSGAGDINRDGFADVAVGMPMADDGRGRVRILSGVPLALTTNDLAVSVTPGGTQTMSLDATPARAAQTYLVLGSGTGTMPGLPLGPVHLPLNFDGYTLTTIGSPNVFPLTSTLGSLDGSGRATASFTLPGTFFTALAGLTLHHAFVVWEGGTFTFASNPVQLAFVN